MGSMDIGNAQTSNLTNTVADIEISSMDTDGVSGLDETEYQNSKWSQYWGYFNAVAELKSALLLKVIWNVGKGYTTDPKTEVILDHVSGWGKDSFNDVLFNMVLVAKLGGDSYAEIIRAEDGTLLNLKPLDPGTMKIIVDSKGMIKRYEQTNKNPVNKAVVKFKPEEIFHLSNNRLADQIHGISDIVSLENTILADNESFEDVMKVMHRQARPLIMFKLKTDNVAKINAFMAKMDKATADGENIYIPDDDDIVSYDVVQVNVNALMMDWRNDIRNKFYRTIGLPQIVPGAGGQSTESESKVIYLAFEQIVEKEQRYIEKQIWNQLNLKIDLVPPTSISQNLMTDASKDGANFQPNDVTAGVGQ